MQPGNSYMHQSVEPRKGNPQTGTMFHLQCDLSQ